MPSGVTQNWLVFGNFGCSLFSDRIHYVVGYIGKNMRSCYFFFKANLTFFGLRSAKKVGAISLKKRLKFASQGFRLRFCKKWMAISVQNGQKFASQKMRLDVFFPAYFESGKHDKYKRKYLKKRLPPPKTAVFLGW